MRGLAVIAATMAGVVIGWTLAENSPLESKEPKLSKEPSTPPAKPPAVPEAISVVLQGGGLRLGFDQIANLMLQLETATTADCRHWLQTILDGKVPDSHIIDAIIGRWTELDAAGALDFVRKNSNNIGSYSKVILREWAATDLDAAAEAAAFGPQPGEIQSVIEGAQADKLEHLLDFLQQRGFIHGDNGYHFDPLYSRLANQNPARAASLVLDFQKETYANQTLLRKVVSSWTKDDPSAALQWAEETENVADRDRALLAVAAGWLEANPLEGIRQMWDRVDFGGQPNHPIAMNTAKMSNSDFAELIALVDDRRTDNPAQAAQAIEAMLNGLGDTPSDRLAQILPLIGENDDTGKLLDRISATSMKMAANDEAMVMDAIRLTPNPFAQEAIIQGLVNHWATSDPARALEFLNELDRPMERVYRFGSILENLFSETNDIAATFAKIPVTMHEQALESFAWNLTDDRPTEALAFLDTLPESPNRDQAIQHAIGYTTRENPQTAAAWVEAEPEGKLRQYGALNLANAWARFDSEGAAAWAESLPSGRSRDWALREAATAMALEQPGRAVEMAKKIVDENARSEAMITALQALARRDPNAALGALSGVDLHEQNASQIRTDAETTRVLLAEPGIQSR